MEIKTTTNDIAKIAFMNYLTGLISDYYIIKLKKLRIMEKIEKTPHQKIQESAEDKMRRLGITTVEEIKDFTEHTKIFKGLEENKDKFFDVLQNKLKELTPGQKQILFKAMAEDLDRSYELAEGKPEKQENLQKSLEMLQDLEDKIFIKVPPEKK